MKEVGMKKLRTHLIVLSSMCLFAYMGQSLRAQERRDEAKRGEERGGQDNQAGRQHFPRHGPARGTAQPRPENRGGAAKAGSRRLAVASRRAVGQRSVAKPRTEARLLLPGRT
jgi:hypothetical protein